MRHKRKQTRSDSIEIRQVIQEAMAAPPIPRQTPPHQHVVTKINLDKVLNEDMHNAEYVQHSEIQEIVQDN